MAGSGNALFAGIGSGEADRIVPFPLSSVRLTKGIFAEQAEINARYLEPGQPVEVTFKFIPGQVYPGRVETILQAVLAGGLRIIDLVIP